MAGTKISVHLSDSKSAIRDLQRRGGREWLQTRMSLVKESLEAVQGLADKGDVEALCELGYRYYTGNGVEKNKESSCKYFVSAAEKGHVEAQYEAGLRCERGWGVDIDLSAAAQWYEKAAAQKHKKGQVKSSQIHFLL